MSADITTITTITAKDGRAVIELSNSSVIALSSDQILAVIEQLHACYDYCAAWKEPTQEQDRAVVTGAQP